VACDFREWCIFLCEISYSSQLADLAKRLRQWHENWQDVWHALARDSHVPSDWPVRPWLFVPEGQIDLLVKRLQTVPGVGDPSNSTERRCGQMLGEMEKAKSGPDKATGQGSQRGTSEQPPAVCLRIGRSSLTPPA
jgi:hypothetical protein